VCQATDPRHENPALHHVYYDARKSLAVATDGKACFRAKVDLGDDSGFFNSARVRLNVESDKGFPNWKSFVKKHTHKETINPRYVALEQEAEVLYRVQTEGGEMWFRAEYVDCAVGGQRLPLHISYTPGKEIYPVEFRISPTRRATIMPCRNPEA